MTFQRILPRRDTAANWTAANPVLAVGELGLETDTGKIKRGDGVTAWTALAYSLTEVGATTAIDAHLGGDATNLVPTVNTLQTDVAAKIDTATADATYARRPTASRVVDLPTPTIIAHKGGANIAPEETIEGYRAAQAYGVHAIDADANLLLDGKSIAVMHDSTVDRTTTSSGPLANMLPATVQNLTVDAGSWFGGNWGNLKVPLLSQVLNEFGNRIVTVIESKTAGACATALAGAVNRFGVQESVIVASAFFADIPTLAATGAHTQYVMSTGLEQTPSAIKAAGAASVAIDYTSASLTSALVSSMHAAGLKVYGYTIDSQSAAATFFATGGDGIFSNDPIYVGGPQNGYSYRLTKMPFVAQTYYHGHIPGAAGIRGVYTAPDGWGFNDTTNMGGRTVLAGAISPIKGDPNVNQFTIDFTMKIDSQSDTGRFLGFFICAADDRTYSDNGAGAGVNGYRLVINGLGTMGIAKYTNGSAVTNFATTDTPDLVYPATITGQIIVTPTTITLTRTDTGTTYSTAATDSTYRGGYVWLEGSGTTGRWTRVEVTA